MNCKPGDLAYTVAPFWEGGRGQVVTVVREGWRGREGSETWHCVGRIVMEDGYVVDAWDIDKTALRPIRDPGDEAQDETLSWLPVPTVEGIPA